jgi:hypothetical protein
MNRIYLSNESVKPLFSSSSARDVWRTARVSAAVLTFDANRVHVKSLVDKIAGFLGNPGCKKYIGHVNFLQVMKANHFEVQF